MEQPNKQIQDLSFRQAMDELDLVVKKLESNSLELEDSLKVYEYGVALLADVQSRLANAQQRVDVLMGELAEKVDDDTQDSSLS